LRRYVYQSDFAIQLGCFLEDFQWMYCEDLRGSMWKLFLEQADVDPGEIEVVEATPRTGFNYFQVLIKFDKIQEA
jgi:elongation factor P hydroxylase